MTLHFYTEADLHHEAARQLKNATEDPDFMGIGEQMTGTVIPSRQSESRNCWHDLDDLEDDTFGQAQRAISDLLDKAADVSEYAVDLGAARLKPEHHRLISHNGNVFAAFHIALDPLCELSQQTYAAIEDLIRHDIAFR